MASSNRSTNRLTPSLSTGALEALARERAGDGLAGCLRVGGGDPVAAGSVARPPQRLSDLVLMQMVPEDAWWPVRLGAPDGLIPGGDEAHMEVVDGFGKGSSTTWSRWTVVASTSEGVHPKTVSDLLGHSQIGITLDLYSHVMATMQAVAAEATGRLLGSHHDSKATRDG